VTTVVLVDAAAMRRALRESLLGEPGVRIVGEAGSLGRALPLAERLQPGIVLLDAEMADLDLMAAIRAFRQRVPNSALLVVAIEPDRLAGIARDGDGQVEVVGKVDGPTALLAAVRRVERRSSAPG
jgi:DNA-binding NarL/FixJ family response regulator